MLTSNPAASLNHSSGSLGIPSRFFLLGIRSRRRMLAVADNYMKNAREAEARAHGLNPSGR